MPRAALTLALGVAFGLIAQLLFYGHGLGLNVPLAVTLLFIFGWRLRWVTPSRIDLWIPAFALLFAIFVSIRAEEEVIAFDVLAILVLAAAWSASLRGVTVTRLKVVHLLGEAWDTATGALWRAVPAVPAGLRELPLGGPRRTRVLSTLAGVLLALPLLFLFGALFTSADPVFARWWDDLIDLGEWGERLREGSERGLVAVVMAWLVLGAISWPAQARSDGATRPGLLNSDTATAFVGAIVALFALFIGFQIAYLFGGRDTVAAAGIGYAEYARRGFFELLAVAAITALILFLLDLATARRTRGYAMAALALVGLTGVLLISSVYRLDLYQREFGWSELRVYALAMIVAVAAALGIIAWAVWTRRMSFALQPMVFAALTVALFVNALGPAGFVARANTLQLGPNWDPYYLSWLGPAGIPDLIEASRELPDAERACIEYLLFQRYEPEDADRSWQSWNLGRERARTALVEFRREITSNGRSPRIGACEGFSPRGSFLP